MGSRLGDLDAPAAASPRRDLRPSVAAGAVPAVVLDAEAVAALLG
ncbi:hypothetical protein [Micromonospora sp. NPDC049645]